MGHLVFNANHEAAGSGATSAGGARVTAPKKLLAKPDRGAVAPSLASAGKAPRLASAGKAPRLGGPAKGKAAKSWNEEVELKFLRDTTSKVDTQLHFGVNMDLTDPKKVKELFAQEKVRQTKLQCLLGELSSRAALHVWKMKATDEMTAMMAKARERAQHGFKLAKALGQTSVSHAGEILESLEELVKSDTANLPGHMFLKVLLFLGTEKIKFKDFESYVDFMKKDSSMSKQASRFLNIPFGPA